MPGFQQRSSDDQNLVTDGVIIFSAQCHAFAEQSMYDHDQRMMNQLLAKFIPKIELLKDQDDEHDFLGGSRSW